MFLLFVWLCLQGCGCLCDLVSYLIHVVVEPTVRALFGLCVYLVPKAAMADLKLCERPFTYPVLAVAREKLLLMRLQLLCAKLASLHPRFLNFLLLSLLLFLYFFCWALLFILLL